MTKKYTYIDNELKTAKVIQEEAFRVRELTWRRYEEFESKSNYSLVKRAVKNHVKAVSVVKGFEDNLKCGSKINLSEEDQNELFRKIVAVEVESRKLEVDDKWIHVEIVKNELKGARADRRFILAKSENIEERIKLEKIYLDGAFVESLSYEELNEYIKNYLSKAISELKVKDEDDLAEFGSKAFIESLSFEKLYEFVSYLRHHHYSYGDPCLLIKVFDKGLPVDRLERLVKKRVKFESRLHLKDKKIVKLTDRLEALKFEEVVEAHAEVKGRAIVLKDGWTIP